MKLAVALCALTAQAGVILPAYSQVTDQPDGALPEITVTAERRSANLQDVPVAVTALTAERIEQDAMLKLDRIGAAVPNLYIARNFGTTSGALVFLRGVGEGDSIFTNDPPVGIYVDDVLVPRSTGALFDLIDLESIEVLRGPQGTLYGRNTSGGAIKLTTKRPTFDRIGGAVEAIAGSYRRFDLRGTLNLPLADNAALRVSGISRTQRGWGRNLVDGAHVNGQDVQGGRVSLLWEPGARLSVFATADFSDESSAPRFPQQFLPDPARPGRFLNVFRAPGGDIDNFVSADTDSVNDTRTGGASLRIERRMGDFTLSSITGYRALHSLIGFDQTANAPGAGANIILLQDQDQHNFSQELQIAGDTLGGRLNLLGGLFYFNEHNDQLTAVSNAVPTGTAGARYRTRDFFAAPSRVGASGNWSPYLPTLDTDSWAAFASATMRVLPATKLTAGLRYTHERKRYDVRFLSAPDVTYVLPDGRIAQRVLSDSWDDLSPRVAIDHSLTGNGWSAMLYASASKGFRSGSFDGRARNIDFVLSRQTAIAPETVWNYEGGFKSEWFDKRLRVNATYFINDYRNIAFSAARANLTPPEIFRQNVGSARIQGAEIEVAARPIRQFEVSGWISTLADRLTKLTSSPGCTAFVPDERNLDLRFTPARRFGVRGQWDQPVAGGMLRLSGDYSAASPYYIALCNEPQHRVDNNEAANAQLSFAAGDEWLFSLSITNLTDRRYNTGSVGTIGYPVDPRQYQIGIRRSF
jgi:iron complex outermembrane receptor protein